VRRRWLTGGGHSAGTDETPRVASFYSCALRRSNEGCAKREEGVDGSTWLQSARARAAQRHNSKRGHVKGTWAAFVHTSASGW
jgi:hypothetical protein